MGKQEHETGYSPRPASPSEAGLFYAMKPEQEAALGSIGHLRMDFGRRGTEFWTTWFDHGAGELNTPEFKAEIDDVVNTLRETVLKDRSSMRRFCRESGGELGENYGIRQYGYIVETEHYKYCLRCKPQEGDYDGYLWCFDKRIPEMRREQEKAVDLDSCVRGGENPRPPEDYRSPAPTMRMGAGGMAAQDTRKTLEIKSLAAFKRAVQPGTELVTTWHKYHPDLIGLVRVVNAVQTNGFYSRIKDQPNNKWSLCNHGKGMWTSFQKAKDYTFSDGEVRVLDHKDPNRQRVLYSFKVYDREMTMTEEKKNTPEIKEITEEDLRRMADREGIVFEGCADLPGWVEGINETLTNEGVLLNGSKLEHVSSFQHDGLTCLLFDFEGAELNIGKFAIWRLQSHDQLGGTWLSDYVPNRLGGFTQAQKEKPDCELIGQDGNIYNLMGIASRTLKECGMERQAEEMIRRITGGDCPDYQAALGIIGEYVNITGPDEQEPGNSMEMGGY